MAENHDLWQRPILPSVQPDWSDAIWVGQIRDDCLPNGRMELDGACGFARARFMVRHGRTPRGFVEVDIYNGAVDMEELRQKAALLPEPLCRPTSRTPAISVVICTRNRPAQLSTALRTLLQLNYDRYEVLVVDNGPETGNARAVVESMAHPLLRIVDAPEPGLSKARNIGLRHARHDIVAFTDDDVVVDNEWLFGIADGFAGPADVACVCGMVPSAELNSVSQSYFDRRVRWARNCVRETYRLSDHRPSEPLFPFEVGRFGTGANFAVRRSTMQRIGGFDEGLGVGSPTGGGEDIDMFVRVLLHGCALVYEPAAIVWHRHRTQVDDLRKQIRDYGTGLGAWFTQLALNPRTAAMMLRRSVRGIAHVARMTNVGIEGDGVTCLSDLGRVERISMLVGPVALARARLRGCRRRPLARQPITTAPHVEVLP